MEHIWKKMQKHQDLFLQRQENPLSFHENRKVLIKKTKQKAPQKNKQTNKQKTKDDEKTNHKAATWLKINLNQTWQIW